jgi:methanol metabolism-related c-type cytochrome
MRGWGPAHAPKASAGPLFSLQWPGRKQNVTISRLVLAFVLAFAAPLAARADMPGDPAAVTDDQGMWRDKNGDPTYKVSADGTVDWYTYSGFRRYHSECHVCHGPDGEGSSYAPALANSLKTMSYAEFYGTVVGGKQDLGAGQEKVMPAFADNKNVMCYLNDIYIYLRARSQDAIPRGRPPEHAPKPHEFDEAETKCMGE